MSIDMLYEVSEVNLPIAGRAERFPVRRVYCVGRNYLEHIREMGGDDREPPFFFQKPTDSIVQSGTSVPYPPFTSDFQHEIELVLAVGKAGLDISVDQAGNHIFAVGVGIDLTRRDVQIAARKMGRPWEIGKSFDQSAPCSELVPIEQGRLPTSGKIELRVNDAIKQSGDIDQLIWSCAEIVSKLSEQYRLMPGDLIYTGTPAGVGPLLPGDSVVGSVEGVGAIHLKIDARP